LGKERTMDNTNKIQVNEDKEKENEVQNGSIVNEVDETIHMRPLTDISEGKDEVTIISNIPGVEKENLDISIRENILTLHGEYIAEDEKDPGIKRKVRRCYERQFKIGTDIDVDKIKAAVTQGVVSLTLPRMVKPEPKKISISVH
jgi:HSP20 family protein